MATFVRNKNRATIRTGLFGQAGLPAGEPVEEQVGKQVGEQVKEQTGDRPGTDRGADRKDSLVRFPLIFLKRRPLFARADRRVRSGKER